MTKSLKQRLEDAVNEPARFDHVLLDLGECRTVLSLLAAAHYAAGSFAQVPSNKTVPPIVLHDCRRHLEAAIAKMEGP